jgi:hypothetical protein
MNPDANPYAPGAGMPLPELAGPDEVLEQARVAVRPAKSPKVSTRSFIYVGLRGMGKATFSRCSPLWACGFVSEKTKRTSGWST